MTQLSCDCVSKLEAFSLKNAKHSAKFLTFTIAQIVDNQVEPSLRQNVQKWWKHLQSAFTAAKHDQVVSDQVASESER